MVLASNVQIIPDLHWMEEIVFKRDVVMVISFYKMETVRNAQTIIRQELLVGNVLLLHAIILKC